MSALIIIAVFVIKECDPRRCCVQIQSAQLLEIFGMFLVAVGGLYS